MAGSMAVSRRRRLGLPPGALLSTGEDLLCLRTLLLSGSGELVGTRGAGHEQSQADRAGVPCMFDAEAGYDA